MPEPIAETPNPWDGRRLETVGDLVDHLLANDAIGDEVLAAGVILRRIADLAKSGPGGARFAVEVLSEIDRLELWNVGGEHAKLELDR